jgi:predicted PurR-regulated permease PerM
MADLGSMSREDSLVDQPNAIFARRHTFTIAEVFSALLAVLVVWFAGKVFLIAFGGLLMAVFLYTLARWLADVTRLPYGWSLAVVVIVSVALASTMFWLIGSRLAAQANEFAQAVPRSLRQIRDYLEQFEWGESILKQSPEWGRAIAQGSFPRITDLASSIVDILLALVIMIFVGLYCAAEPDVYVGGMLRLVPVARRARAKEVLTALGYNLRWWLLGQMFAMVCIGLITGIGLWIADAPLALALGLLAAVLEIVPSIGPALWLVPALLVALTQGTQQVINVSVIYGVTHVLESHIVIPLVQRRSVFLPPSLSILAIVLLGLLAGVLGLLVAAPLALVAMLLVKMLYVEDRLGDHNIQVAGEPNH